MGEFHFAIPAQGKSPALHIHANPIHVLYHYLAHQAQLPLTKRNPLTADASFFMEQARNPWGIHGIWDQWEHSLARSLMLQDAMVGIDQSAEQTAHLLKMALQKAEQVFFDVLWPQRIALIETAFFTLQKSFAPFFHGMIQRQGELLELEWPLQIEVFLVTECYAWQGAYSHPLTINIAQKPDLVLCETLLHEITHVGDIYTLSTQRVNFRNRLLAYLDKKGMTHQKAWERWHGIIFASSAQQIRNFIQREYIDYAQKRSLYDWLQMPHLPILWNNFTEGHMDEKAFFEAIVQPMSGVYSIDL